MKTETQTITLAWELAHPPEKVWRALTDPTLVSKWLMGADAAPVAGGAFTLRAEPTPWWDGVVRCQVLEARPFERLRYTWRGGAGAAALDTIVTWTLAATPSGGTRLSLEHSGFAPTNAFAFAGAHKGWQRNVDERLRALLAETAA